MAISFCCDRNLGTLSKWLRILGYDTLYYRGNTGRDFLNKARDEGRIALTRKRNFTGKLNTGSLVVVKTDRSSTQIEEVLQILGLEPDPAKIMTRCLDCNRILNDVAKCAVEGIVPEYIYNTYEMFRKCPSCGKIFWPGTHRRNIVERLRKHSRGRHP